MIIFSFSYVIKVLDLLLQEVNCFLLLLLKLYPAIFLRSKICPLYTRAFIYCGHVNVNIVRAFIYTRDEVYEQLAHSTRLLCTSSMK
jgi:hypothetical protein